MESEILAVLLRIEHAQGEIRGEMRGVRMEQERTANEMVRLWSHASDIETKVEAATGQIAAAKAWVKGMSAVVSAAVVAVWYFITEVVLK